MDTSLDGSTPNASLSSTFSTASLTSIAPANSTQDLSTQSTSQISSVPSSTASRPIVPSHVSSLPVTSHPPSVRSAAAKPDAVSSSSTTDKSDSTPTDPPTPDPSDPPTPTSTPLKSSTDGHTPSPTSSRPHAPNASNTPTSVTPTKKPPPPPPATSKPASPPEAQSSAQTSQASSSQTRASEAQASQKSSTPSIVTPTEGATTSSSTNIIAPSSSISSARSSSEARVTSDTSVKNVSPNALITDLSSLTSGTPLFPTSSEVSSPTGLLTTNNATSGFFANRGAVAGVFVVVGLAVLGLLGFLIFTLFRRCRRYDGYVEDREPSLPNLDAEPSEVEPHYRRMSQVIAFGNVLSAGAAGVGPRAGRRPRSYVGSDASHARSNDTYHSGDPIVRSEKNPFSNFHVVPSSFPGNTDVPPYNYPPYPFRSASRYSQQSAAESSPSIYPPSLPLVNDDDEHWRYRERAPSTGLSQDTTDEQDIVRQQPTPPYSSLGLWTNVPQVTATPQNASENDIRKAFGHRMGPSALDKGNNAPILPPLAHLHSSEDRHVLDSTFTVPSRGGTTSYI